MVPVPTSNEPITIAAVLVVVVVIVDVIVQV